jgi:catechol 2,3-dioxygenase-like lactoylglutathione lyase family enzyme
MIDHLSTYTTDFPAAKRFYETVLATLGYSLNQEMVSTWDPEWPSRRICAFGPGKRTCLWLTEKREASTPRHTAFVAKNRKAVDAFYQAALAIGAKDNGAPGPRPHYHEHYYGAFVLDPDGNNIEAVCHTPERKKVAAKRKVKKRR